MGNAEVETLVRAEPERCFDLIRDRRVHRQTMMRTHGITGLGQTVTFESKYFGFTQRLGVTVIEFDRPRRLVDAMVEGRFRSFVHIHEFEPTGEGTLMRDTLIWESPYGILGRLFDTLILKKHMTDLVTRRNARLKEIAEGNDGL